MAAARVVFRIDAGKLFEGAARARLWGTDQLPFATAAALTDTARQGRDHVRARFGRSFILRNRGLTNAIVFRPADKRGTPIQSAVAVLDWAGFLELHATGGTKRARAGHRVAVPTTGVKRTASGRVPQRLKPRTLRGLRGFNASLLARRALIAVTKRKALQVFFTLHASARIRKRWPIAEQVGEIVASKLAANFARRADEALATRR